MINLNQKIKIDKTRNELRILVNKLILYLEPFKMVGYLNELSLNKYNRQWEKCIDDFPNIVLELENKINNIYNNVNPNYFANRKKHDLIWILLNWERYEALKAIFELYDDIKYLK